MDRGLVLVEVLDELDDAALVEEGVATPVALVLDDDLQALVEERELAQAVRQRVEGVGGLFEDLGVGLEGDGGAALLRLPDDGELLLRTDTIFAGYLKDEEATREVLTDDGWLRTGDVAEIDGDGFVRITDRKKDILVTAGGKNVAPQNVENALKTAPLV